MLPYGPLSQYAKENVILLRYELYIACHKLTTFQFYCKYLFFIQHEDSQ